MRITGGAGFPSAHVPSGTAQTASGGRAAGISNDTSASIGISWGAGRSAGTGRSGGRRTGRGPL